MFRIIIFCFFAAFNVQCQDPLNFYAPQNTKTFNDLKEAISSKSPVYKLRLYNDLERKDYVKLFQLKKLEAISLNSKTLDSIESGFGSLKSLRYVEILCPLRHFPSDFASCPRIESLVFSGTKFRSIPSNIFYNPTFQKLSINSNKDSLRLFIPNISQNNLSSLILFNTSIDSLSIPKKMKEISIARCYITGNEPWFKDLDNATTLDLSYNQIESFEAFKSFKNVQYLYLNKNQLTHAPEYISRLGNLKELDLSGNNIPQYEIDILKVLMPQCNIIVD